MASALPRDERPDPPPGDAAAARRPGIVLVGNPNVGKSALFGVLTGTYVTVSNYPGTTVEVSTGTASVGGRDLEVIDTPGTASFLPSSEDERVTRDILLAARAQAVVAVADVKNLERGLLLAVQLSEMAVPHVLCLNMMDEAAARGIHVDVAGLAARLGVPVVPTVAIRRDGIRGLLASLDAAAVGGAQVGYPPAIERAVTAVAPVLPEAPVSRRALALMALAGDETLAPWLQQRVAPDVLAVVDAAREHLHRELSEPLASILTRARLRAAANIARGLTQRPATAARPRLLERLEPLTTHPVWGLPILAAVLAVAYVFVGVFGARTLVDLLEQGLFGQWISPWATALADRFIPWDLLRDALVGPYGLVTMALAYSLALVLPIVGTFFIAFGVLEDSGYLPRLAVMVNRVFKSIGLNGKAVLPMVLGLGCDTMATLTTRILDSPKERLIVILLLALGVPCSAQLTVILAMLTGLPAAAFLIWLAVVAGVIVIVGRLAARALPGRGSDFVLELPPLRWPQARNILVKTLARVEWYLKEAVPLFVLGTLILFAADRLHLLGAVERAAAPIVTGLLGLPPETAEAFVIGFLRRDFGAAGLYRLAREGRMSGAQTVVALVTITLFIPCIAQFFMMVKERGWRTALAIAAFVFPFAILVGAALRALLAVAPMGLR
jgi:ferrous iron transport protein B